MHEAYAEGAILSERDIKCTQALFSGNWVPDRLVMSQPSLSPDALSQIYRVAATQG